MTLLVLLRRFFFMQAAKAVVHQPIAASIAVVLSKADNYITSVPLGYKSNTNIATYLE